MCCNSISAVLPPGQFEGKFLTSMRSRQPMLNYCSAQTEAWGGTCKNVTDPRYRMLERRFQHWLLLSFLLAIHPCQRISLSYLDCVPMPQMRAHWLHWGCFPVLQHQGKARQASAGGQAGCSAVGEDGYIGKIIHSIKANQNPQWPTNYFNQEYFHGMLPVVASFATHCKLRISQSKFSTAAFCSPKRQWFLYSTNLCSCSCVDGLRKSTGLGLTWKSIKASTCTHKLVLPGDTWITD